MFADKEHWSAIRGFPNYQVSSKGRVRSRAYGDWRTLAPIGHSGGYKTIVLCRNGKQKKFYLHRLVLLAFVGRPPRRNECCHLDGSKANNRLDNLAWGTKAENESHKAIHDTLTLGERNGWAKLTEKQVLEIRAIELRPFQYGGVRDIAKKYGLTKEYVHRLRKRKTWSHI